MDTQRPRAPDTRRYTLSIRNQRFPRYPLPHPLQVKHPVGRLPFGFPEFALCAACPLLRRPRHDGWNWKLSGLAQQKRSFSVSQVFCVCVLKEVMVAGVHIEEIDRDIGPVEHPLAKSLGKRLAVDKPAEAPAIRDRKKSTNLRGRRIAGRPRSGRYFRRARRGARWRGCRGAS